MSILPALMLFIESPEGLPELSHLDLQADASAADPLAPDYLIS